MADPPRDSAAIPAELMEAPVEEERRVTSLELFFDLVFVFAITQVTGFIYHDPTWTRLVEAVALLIGCVFLTIAYVRTRWAESDLYPSLALLRSSFTVIIVGGYLIAVGVLVDVGIGIDVDAAQTHFVAALGFDRGGRHADHSPIDDRDRKRRQRPCGHRERGLAERVHQCRHGCRRGRGAVELGDRNFAAGVALERDRQ